MRVLVLVVKVVLAGILIGQVGFGSQVGVMDIKGKEDLNRLKIADLQRELESRGLDSSGKKSELVDRLWETVCLEGQAKSGLQNSEVKDQASMELSQDQVRSDTSVASSEAPQILARLKALKEIEQLEEQELRIKMRRKQIELEVQLASISDVKVSAQELDSLRIATASKGEPECSKESSVISSHMQRMLLPPTEVEKFDGDILKYKLFVNSFEARIVSRTTDQLELLHYLEQLTVGRPKQIVRSCMCLGEAGYQKAWELLEQRYGSTHRVVDAYVEKVNQWRKIQSGDVEELDKLTLFLIEVKHVMIDLGMAGELEHPRTLREIIQKLPPPLRDRWRREADKLMEKESGTIRFRDLVSFLEREVRILKNPVFGLSKVSAVSGPTDCTKRVNVVKFSSDKQSCVFCKGAHHLDECEKLRYKPYGERKALIAERRLCYGCLRAGHTARFCRNRLRCRICGFGHATLLHRTGAQEPVPVAEPGRSPAPGGKAPTVLSAGVGVNCVDKVSSTMMPIIPVRLAGKGGKKVVTNAFLDQGSSGCFLTTQLASHLGLEGQEVSIEIDTVASQGQEIRSSVVKGVKVGPVTSDECFELPSLFTLDSIPVSPQDRCRSDDQDQWEHLADIPLHELNAPVEMMIGSNAAFLLAAQEVRSPAEGLGPVGVKTSLGWYVIGPRCPGAGGDGDPRALVNFLRLTEPKVSKRMELTDLIHSMYEAEFRDSAEDTEAMSVSDREWIAEAKASIRKDDEGHYEVALPRTQLLGDIPDSFPTAKGRLESLKKKFKRDPQYFEAYKEVIHSLSRDGYAVKVPDAEVDRQQLVWYLPHHGVQEVAKGKLRVVFDCAARSGGISLNDMLKAGPNLTNSLVGVLCRFREGPIAFTCDVEAMFHRVHVPESDSEMLRFLWFHNDDLEGKVEVWKMRSHVFGAVSSSSVASLALKHCAAEVAEQYPEAARVVEENMYVDDALVSVSSVEEGVQLAAHLRQLCRTGAFNLRKFASNNAEFLRSIPVEDRSKNAQTLDLAMDSLKPERALGMLWSVDDDSFRFRFVDRQRPVTRRGILSTVSGLFDPLGIVSPVTLQGRVLVQKLCSMSCGWDDVIPEELADEWARWLSGARQLDSVRLERDISGPPGVVLSTELHIFADASETAHAAVAYVRREVETVSGDKEVFVKFVYGKSRLNPIRCVQSVPRLELTAAALAVRIKQLLIRELAMEFDSVRLWSDSLIVLSCIRNRTTRFKTFVANRLSLIHSVSEVADWGYVPSKLNPADVGSRGARPDTLQSWLEGPGFLSQDRGSWPEEPSVGADVPKDEVRVSARVGQVGLADGKGGPSDSLVGHYSSFYRLKRAVAWMHRFCDVIRTGAYRRFCLARRRGLRCRKSEWRTVLELSDVQKAEAAILRHAQTSLVECPGGRAPDGPVHVRKASQLASLRPLMRDGLLVVGGRLGSSPSLSDRSKHPVIIPRHHHVARLLIREAHISVGHQGRDHTLWRLRERYWVIGAGSDVRKMIKACVVCRKVNARPQEQMMADLPETRVTAGTPAFEKVGLDVFGPFMVRSGRCERKRFGLMCTCLVTRAVHIEVLHSLTTDSLINAVRRISARRGAIRYIISDRGTNLVGAERELREALNEVDYDRLQGEYVKQGIHWEFNPPTASHFSGATERQIRTFRKIWRSMPTQRVSDEVLHTVFCEVEAIVNDRPLTYISVGSNSLEPITPAHLLLLRGGAGPAPGVFSEGDSFSRRRWRQAQYLASQFWLRFVREFLPTLQARQKWTRETRNMREGDIVLLTDKDAPRGLWQMGRVIDVHHGKDNLVRSALVQTATSRYLRPIHKMVLVHSGADLDW